MWKVCNPRHSIHYCKRICIRLGHPANWKGGAWQSVILHGQIQSRKPSFLKLECKSYPLQQELRARARQTPTPSCTLQVRFLDVLMQNQFE